MYASSISKLGPKLWRDRGRVFGRVEQIRPGRFSPVSASGRWLGSAARMPARLRPTAPIAADAILVGDPGRALMLAQELLRAAEDEQPRAWLWGYTGRDLGRAR